MRMCMHNQPTKQTNEGKSKMENPQEVIAAYIRDAEAAAAKIGCASYIIAGVERASATVNERGHKEVRVRLRVATTELAKIPFDTGCGYENLEAGLKALSATGTVAAAYHITVGFDREVWDALVEEGESFDPPMPAPRILAHWALTAESVSIGCRTADGKERRSIRLGFPQSIWVENRGPKAKKFDDKDIIDYSKSVAGTESTGDKE